MSIRKEDEWRIEDEWNGKGIIKEKGGKEFENRNKRNGKDRLNEG